MEFRFVCNDVIFFKDTVLFSKRKMKTEDTLKGGDVLHIALTGDGAIETEANLANDWALKLFII